MKMSKLLTYYTNKLAVLLTYIFQNIHIYVINKNHINKKYLFKKVRRSKRNFKNIRYF